MRYSYEKTRENGDATSNYNIVGEFPIKFSEFFRAILETDNSFKIEFGASNNCFGGWLGNRLRVRKDTKTGTCYWEDQQPHNWYDEIKDLMITGCWANGGWGQMLYIVTFEDQKEDNV